MLFVKRESQWKFNTSSTGGLGVAFVAVAGGVIYCTAPGGAIVSFRYGAAGVGYSAGFKLPRIGKIQVQVWGKSVGVGAAAAPAAFPNRGRIYISESFGRDELTRSDITGACMFVEVGGGLIVGGSGTAMLLGMNPLLLPTLMIHPPVAIGQSLFVQSATAVLLMAGVNAGLVAGGGIAGFVGGLM